LPTYVRIPSSQLPSKRMSAEQGRQRVPAPKRVLVADDNVDAAEAVALLLELSGHEVAVAANGLDAVRKADQFEPQVILLDIGMPGLNGHEVCRQIRARSWGGRARIVAVTGWGDEEDRRRSRDAGFDLHLVKPVDPDLLDVILTG
jgi:CheY-like chemotaxis protein